MSEDSFEETLILRVSLSGELPSPIYSGDPPEPVEVDSATIMRVGTPRGDSFNLQLYDPTGRLIDFFQYDTLEIAFDQAADILGVEPEEWRSLEP